MNQRTDHYKNYYDYKIADNLAVVFMKLEVWEDHATSL